jgi:hypothetical protein
MKGWFRKGVLAAAIVLPALSGTQIAVSAQSGQEQEGKEQQPLEGVWDISVTVRSCTTGAVLATGRVIQVFNDGGTLTEIADRANRSAGLGTWHHLGGRSYTTHHEIIEYSAAGTFNGTTVITREIELSETGDEFTATTTFRNFNANDQLFNTGCATPTATRFE